MHLTGGALASQTVHYDAAPDVAVAVDTDVEIGGAVVDLYSPAGAGADARPVVVFVFAYPDSLYGPMRKHPAYVSWARLLAAVGFASVLPAAEDPLRDLQRVLDALVEEGSTHGLDANRVALWSSSGNTPLALKAARTPGAWTPAAVVSLYGLMPTAGSPHAAEFVAMSRSAGFVLPDYDPAAVFPPALAFFIARAGKDEWEVIRRSTDDFIASALAQNADVVAINYPEGRHAFDVVDDTPQTRWIISQAILFLRQRLSNPG